MTVRWSSVALVLLLASLPAVAQPSQVLPARVGGVAPQAMMSAYLMREAEARFEQWRNRFEEAKTPEQIAAYQQAQQQFFREQLGDDPQRTPLNPKVTGTVEREGYVVEKILFESRPRFYVTAALFLPRSGAHQPPYPGVIVVCGHSADGKALVNYQNGAALLALNGIAALVVDPIHQGERYQIVEPDGRLPIAGPTEGHSLIGLGSILLGSNVAQIIQWDNVRAVDYLASRPEIDAQRIGCMGNSGGGTQTSYLMALDERIVAAAPSCYLTSFERLLKTIGPQDAEQNIFAQVAAGMDHADYVLMRAPKPTLICAATSDFFDIRGTWDTFRYAKRWYGRLGYAERIDLIEHEGPHGWSVPLREGSVRFMLRWLAGRDEAVVEPEIQPLSKEELRVSPRGQVLLIDGARSAYDLNLEENRRLAEQRAELWKDPPRARAAVRKIARIRPLAELPTVEADAVGETTVAGRAAEKYILRPEAGIYLPAVLVPPAADAPRPKAVALVLHDGGMARALADGGIAAGPLGEGLSVLAADVRGVGETQSTTRWYVARFGPDGRDIATAYLLGKSYVGMRAEDILVLARWAQQHLQLPAESVHLIATGHLGTPALHAAALEPELFASVRLERPLVSWTNLLETPITENQFVNVVHGALQAYDLPDLAGTLQGKLQQTDRRDAAGHPVDRQ